MEKRVLIYPWAKAEDFGPGFEAIGDAVAALKAEHPGVDLDAIDQADAFSVHYIRVMRVGMDGIENVGLWRVVQGKSKGHKGTCRSLTEVLEAEAWFDEEWADNHDFIHGWANVIPLGGNPPPPRARKAKSVVEQVQAEPEPEAMPAPEPEPFLLEPYTPGLMKVDLAGVRGKKGGKKKTLSDKLAEAFVGQQLALGM